MEIPEHVTIHKDEKPKGWSYPLQTGEIIASLALNEVDLPFTISYSNSLPWTNQKITRHYDSFPILGLTYYGKHYKKSSGRDRNRMYMVVQVVPSKHRKFLNQIVMEGVLPVLRKWVREVQEDPMLMQDIAQAALRYGNEWNITGTDYNLDKYLTLAVNRKTLLWSKKIDLNPKEGDEILPRAED